MMKREREGYLLIFSGRNRGRVNQGNQDKWLFRGREDRVGETGMSSKVSLDMFCCTFGLDVCKCWTCLKNK